MGRWLVRPYPVGRLPQVRTALQAAAAGDVLPLQKLYRQAAEALQALDPDEVEDYRREHRRAHRSEQHLAHSAVALADTWEGLVVLGASLRRPARFRGFAWLAAQVRYGLEPARRDAGQLRRYAQGAPLPDTEPEDAALFAALPALIGLGPELPEELEGPCPLEGTPVAALLGLPEDDDWAGVDPLDAVAVSAETCRARYPAVTGGWRAVVGRGLQDGLLIRPA